MTEIEDFVMYCCYELIANKRKPTYNVLVILEKILASSGMEILVYALAHAYIEHNFVTKISDRVKKEAFDLCEKNKISFPTFKKVKDKNILTPYIEKNQPFIYKSVAGKRVFLRYRSSSSGEFRSVPMQYFRFGFYIAVVPHFYGESLFYRIETQTAAGVASSAEREIKNNEQPALQIEGDEFYQISNMLIREQTLWRGDVERLVEEKLRDLPDVKAELI
jgi:hypothetical protein